ARKKGKSASQVIVLKEKSRKKRQKSRGQQPTRQVTPVSAPAAMGTQITYRGPQVVTQYGDITPAKNSGSLVRVTSSATAGTEVSGTVLFNVRNATELPWLSGQGSRYSKYRVRYAHFTWEPIVGSNTNGEVAMAMLYDVADVTSITIERLMQTRGGTWGPIWSPTRKRLSYDPEHASLPWYLSGVSSGAAAGNIQTPFQIAWAAQSSLVSTTLGRIMAEYLVELTDPVDVTINQ
nr:Chain A, RYEGRASS MOTTLE VIRUS COAT PROTEIN [Ryegrass mottle virus]2IZW_B Chain B, RYEGRASS MOTTLE VIRUS COAT PROTEIN [Ryegrass mottle virus]2IZW_C Chain C, RYEGRASS MOTTLE VIRUS COAT PROTEIN [Ryegrass mottle virus]